MRLVANRLFSERSLQEAITDFAASKLRELLPAPKQPAPALMPENPGSANGTDVTRWLSVLKPHPCTAKAERSGPHVVTKPKRLQLCILIYSLKSH